MSDHTPGRASQAAPDSGRCPSPFSFLQGLLIPAAGGLKGVEGARVPIPSRLCLSQTLCSSQQSPWIKRSTPGAPLPCSGWQALVESAGNADAPLQIFSATWQARAVRSFQSCKTSQAEGQLSHTNDMLSISTFSLRVVGRADLFERLHPLISRADKVQHFVHGTSRRLLPSRPPMPRSFGSRGSWQLA